MKTIGTCSVCGGAVQVPDDENGTATCVTCGAVAESNHGALIKMRPTKVEPVDELRRVIEDVVGRWAPSINENEKQSNETFEKRMIRALINLHKFEVDYNRVMAGGTALATGYPLALPNPPQKKPV